MGEKPQTELELSPTVIDFWKKRGYCVHGEVAVFRYSIFIDHVAHTGPCEEPTRTVGIEMKKGAGKNLRKQIFKLDVKHVVDEIWGAVISNPRSDTLAEWEDLGRWNRPGLLGWTEDGLKVLQEPGTNREYKKANKTQDLLLVNRNKDVLGGYPSGDESYLTHYSLLKDEATEFLESVEGEFTLEDVRESLTQRHLDLYKKPNSAVKRIMEHLLDEDPTFRQIGREGKIPLYRKLGDEADSRVDERFLYLLDDI